MNEAQRLLLQIVGAVLFGKEVPTISAENMIESLVNESKSQAVFPLLFSVLESQLQERLSPEQYQAYSEDFFRYAIAGTQNFAEHSELHELMTHSQIPYTVLKGFASALYYPEPSLRSMGDVDFIVYSQDLSRAGSLLESVGFVADHAEDDEGKHIAYSRPPMSIWELHRTVNGIPRGEKGELIRTEMEKVIDSAELVAQEDVICMVPDHFHHGLIMLLHMASHLTSEGVGLRHLCDWVVFASSMSDAEFRNLFEKKLKSFGLWQFAQVLMLLGINYLGVPKRVWALEALESHKVEEGVLTGLINDILSGGNFGTKDMNRYREIKYISDRRERTVSSVGNARQVIRSMNEKVCVAHKFIGKHKMLYPIGYIAEGGKYFGLLITGKRKSSSTKRMLKEASERKRIYSSLNLFQ